MIGIWRLFVNAGDLGIILLVGTIVSVIIFLIGVLLMSCSKDQKVAVISTKFGDMVVEFFPDFAPKHVENFQILGNS